MASVMQATSSAYKSGMLWWRYGGLNLFVWPIPQYLRQEVWKTDNQLFIY